MIIKIVQPEKNSRLKQYDFRRTMADYLWHHTCSGAIRPIAFRAEVLVRIKVLEEKVATVFNLLNSRDR